MFYISGASVFYIIFFISSTGCSGPYPSHLTICTLTERPCWGTSPSRQPSAFTRSLTVKMRTSKTWRRPANTWNSSHISPPTTEEKGASLSSCEMSIDFCLLFADNDCLTLIEKGKCNIYTLVLKYIWKGVWENVQIRINSAWMINKKQKIIKYNKQVSWMSNRYLFVLLFSNMSFSDN